MNASGRVENLRERISILKEQRDALLVTYTSEWPAVKKIDAQIKGIEEELQSADGDCYRCNDVTRRGLHERTAAAFLRRAERDHYSANARHDRFDGAHAPTRDQQAVAQHIAATKARARRGEWKQRQRSKYRHPSRLPKSPVGPPRLRNIIIAFLLSLGGGIGLAFLLDFLDDTVKSVEDVDRYIHLPALALIPAGGDRVPRLPRCVGPTARAFKHDRAGDDHRCAFADC